MKKGFTLVELLAVIVILAIILAIAIPAITGLIKKTTINAMESDAKMVLKAIEYKMLEVNGYDPTTIDATNILSELNISAKNYESVTVTIVNGKPHVEIVGKNKWSGLTAHGIFANITVVDDEEYGGPPSFACGDTLIDSRDSEEYPTVLIGEQCWMQENLRYTDSGNLDCLTNEWTIGAPYNACRLNGGEEWDQNEVLYQWVAAMDDDTEEGSQGLCPNGWYTPTDDDFKQLEIYLGMTEVQTDGTGWRGTNQGDKLKSSSPSWCGDVTECATSGFEGVPAGERNTSGSLGSVGSFGTWWTSSPSESYAWRRNLFLIRSSVSRHAFLQAAGFSIRCIMNQ